MKKKMDIKSRERTKDHLLIIAKAKDMLVYPADVLMKD